MNRTTTNRCLLRSRCLLSSNLGVLSKSLQTFEDFRLLHKIELVRTDIHISNNPGFVNHKRCWTRNVVRLQTQPVVNTVTFDNLPCFVHQQWERNTIFIRITPEFTGPLPRNRERRCRQFRVCVHTFLHSRQLAAAIRSPCPAKKGQNDMLRPAVCCKGDLRPLMRRKRE